MQSFARLLFAASLAASWPAAAVVSNLEDLDDFGRLAAQALDSVGSFDPVTKADRDDTKLPPLDNRMLLDWWRPGRKYDFPFYGDKPNAFIGVHCEQSQEFHIVANANDQAQFNIGVCKAEAVRARDLAVKSEAASKAVTDPLLNSVPAESKDKVGKMLVFRKVSLQGGMTGYAFTLVAVGHGVEFVNEALVFDPTRKLAFIVQGDVGQLCGHSMPDGKGPFAAKPFCTDTAKALLDVAADLARRYK
jgi:hypothetical protein